MADLYFITPSRRSKDLTGKTFGRLTAVGPVGRRNNSIAWLCICQCGTEHITSHGCLTRKKKPTRSCGCLIDESKPNLTHGMRGTAIYNSWSAMRSRVMCVTDKDYPNYGGRGIEICPEWDLFEKFHEDMGDRPEGTTLGRMDNSGDYTTDNCRWETITQQNRNKRTTHRLTLNGKTMTSHEWDRELGFSRGRVRQRLKDGWSAEKALTTPLLK